MSKFCSNCGTALVENSTFCHICGKNVKAVQQPVQPQAQPVYQTPTKEKQKVPGRGFGISSMVLGIVGLLYATSCVEETIIFLQTSLFSVETIYSQMITIAVFATCSILALCFSSGAKKRMYINNISKSGGIMGVIGVCLCIFCALIVIIGALRIF